MTASIARFWLVSLLVLIATLLSGSGIGTATAASSDDTLTSTSQRYGTVLHPGQFQRAEVTFDRSTGKLHSTLRNYAYTWVWGFTGAVRTELLDSKSQVIASAGFHYFGVCSKGEAALRGNTCNDRTLAYDDVVPLSLANRVTSIRALATCWPVGALGSALSQAATAFTGLPIATFYSWYLAVLRATC